MKISIWRSSVLLAIQVCLVAAASPAAAQGLPSGWSAGDVGAVGVRGSAAHANGTFSVSGAGADIWGQADAFMFVHRRMTGDGSIVARVTSVQHVHEWTKAGVMIRESLTAGSRHAFALVTPARGLAFQHRTTAGATTTYTGTPGSVPVWLKLQRTGSLITASRSADGLKWTVIGTQHLTLPATVYVGLAVTSHASSRIAAAAFTSVSVSGSASLPAGWSSSDIGGGAPGQSRHAEGLFTIDGAGRDIWSASDQFRFTYRQVTGDIDIVARVASVQELDVWTKAGLMVRATLTAPSRHASIFVTPRRGVAFQWRAADASSSEYTAAGGRMAPWWVMLSRRGSAITAYQSADGTTWSYVGAQTLAMPATFYVGLAVASRSETTTATATFDNVTVQPPGAVVTPASPVSGTPPVANQSPLVTLTSPVSRATFSAPASMTVTATASDSDGTVARVDFYQGPTLMASDTTAPYSASWSRVPAGSYSLTAVARDNAGATTVSSVVTVTVNDPVVPTRAVFAPSLNHAAAVDRYIVEFFPVGADPAVASPAATADVGKPVVVSGQCEASVAEAVGALPSGAYFATVTAVGPGGAARSAPSAAFMR